MKTATITYTDDRTLPARSLTEAGFTLHHYPPQDFAAGCVGEAIVEQDEGRPQANERP
jgi:hypothetical protein